MPIEIDLAHPESRSWLANDEPTRYSRLGEPLSDDVIHQGVSAKLKENIENLLECREADFVHDTLQSKFTAGIRSQVAIEVLLHLAESDFDVVEFYKDVLREIEENSELEGTELLTEARERTVELLLEEEIPAEILNQIAIQVINRHQDPVARMIEGLEQSDQSNYDDISYSYDTGHETVRVEQTG
jgi:hypothetical protein